MRAAWFGLGIIAILLLGIGLFVPKFSKQRKTSTLNITTVKQNPNTVSVATVLSDPGSYSGRRLCLTGYYQKGYQFAAMSAEADMANSRVKAPYIWTQLNVPTGSLQCQIGAGQQQTCFGFVTFCGLFTYKAEGGLGQAGAYKYKLSQ